MDFNKIAERLNHWISTIDDTHLMGYLYLISILLFLVFIAFKYGKVFMKAIFGTDGELNIIESAVFVWFILYPNAVLADVFLGLTASNPVWTSLDILMIFILTGKVATSFIHHKHGEHKEHTPPPPTNEGGPAPDDQTPR